MQIELNTLEGDLPCGGFQLLADRFGQQARLDHRDLPVLLQPGKHSVHCRHGMRRNERPEVIAIGEQVGDQVFVVADIGQGVLIRDQYDAGGETVGGVDPGDKIEERVPFFRRDARLKESLQAVEY